MKKTFIKAAAPALAIGLAFSGQAGAESPNGNGNAKAQANSANQVVQYKGASLSHRLTPVENRLSSVESEVNSIVSELEGVGSLTPVQFEYYQGLVDSLFGKVNASTNQLNAITKKFDDNATEIVGIEGDINTIYGSALEVQSVLNDIKVVPEVPENEEPEIPIEEPEVPDTPIEDGTEEVIEEETGEVIDEVIGETVEQ